MNLGREKKQHIIVPQGEPVPGTLTIPDDEPRRVGFEPSAPDLEPEEVPQPA